MEPTWPTHVTGAAVTSFTKTDRSDGYDFSLSFRYERENGVPEIWDTTGSVFQRSDGLEWSADLKAQGVAPGQLPSRIPQKVVFKITYGDDLDGELRSATVERAMTYLDGHSVTSKDVTFVMKEPPNPNVDEYLTAFARIFNGDSFTELFRGE